MDWELAIRKNREALAMIIAGLVDLVALGRPGRRCRDAAAAFAPLHLPRFTAGGIGPCGG